MFALTHATIQKHVEDHVLRSNAFAALYGFPGRASLTDPEAIKNLMNSEMHTILNNKKLRTGSFEPYFHRMIKDAVVKYGWTPPEDRITRFGADNPARLIDGHHRMEAMRNISGSFSTMGASGSPYPMVIHKFQMRHIARELWKAVYPCHRDTIIVLMLGMEELNKKRKDQLIKLASGQPATHLIYSFYNETRPIQWWAWIRGLANNMKNQKDRERFCCIATDLIWDAAGLAKEHTLSAQYRTPTVMGLLKDMRTRDDYSTMPILADALEDAGFPHTELLEHYRNPLSYFSGGSWIFRKAGIS
jgi:hypothetical protein